MEKRSKNCEITPKMRKEMVRLLVSTIKTADNQTLKRIYLFAIHTR